MTGRSGSRRGGLRRTRATVGLALVTLVLALATAACGPAARVVVTPAPSPAASTTLSQVLLTARAQVMAALVAGRLQVIDARTPYRPAESPALADAPRAVLQVIMPAAPDSGFVVLYEFPDPGTATAAAQEFAQYLASGPGRIQFPNDAHFTLRQLGAALAFHVWSPSASTAPDDEQAIETALGSVGLGYTILR